MTDAALLGMLRAHAALGACAELTARLAAGLAHGVGVGETTARDAAAIFRVRQVTAREAQLSVSGLDQAVAALAGLGDQRVTWRHYRSECELFTVFVVDAMVVGCLRVTTRARATGREDSRAHRVVTVEDPLASTHRGRLPAGDHPRAASCGDAS